MHGFPTARIALTALFVAAIAACSDDTSAPATSFYATMNGEKAGTGVPATGVATFGVSGNNFTWNIEVTGLSGVATAAHIHLGEADETGSPIVNICGAGSTPACTFGPGGSMSGTTELVGAFEDVLDEMRTFGAYVNVHTAAYTGGEIRGQVLGVY